MGILEDTQEVNSSGLRGIVQQMLKEGRRGFVLELEGGWRGEQVVGKPLLGTGPFLYVDPGAPVLRFENVLLDEQPSEFRVYV